jgi:Cd2+/Zn2+-exporting ATPase
VISDRIRQDAHAAVSGLRRNGVDQILMLTGDNGQAAGEVAGNLKLDGYFADLLPEDKVH